MAIVLVRPFVNLLRECSNQALSHGRDSQGIFQIAWHVTDPDFDGAEFVMRANVPPDFPNRVDESGVDHVVHEPNVLTPIAHQSWQSGGRKTFHDLRAMRLQARGTIFPKRAAAAERQKNRQVLHDAVADHYGLVAGINADMDMKPESDKTPRHLLKEIDKALVPLVGSDLLFAPK